MTSWTTVPLYVLALGCDVEPGADVPGRVAAMEALRRDGRVDGMHVGVAAGAIDWAGLDAAVARLDAEDVHGPQVVLMPRARA
ncbi:MAG: hypothetical protein Q8S73_12655 [Deltaproteobacteria bacterium]|nr:hypothetical protein [Myxococcales bacterium]MDP3214950.1 hypothetical protein [Deltaproteobacteria bacterium]